MILWPTCEETFALLSDRQDGALPPLPSLGVELHLLRCPHCRNLAATLRALPQVVRSALVPPGDPVRLGQLALEEALARLAQPPQPRPWPATPVPLELEPLLEKDPDLPLRVLAAAHRALAGHRNPPAPRGPYPIPQEALDLLPPEEQWLWEDRRDGIRKAELLPGAPGARLFLVYAPRGSRFGAHRHLGSESVLVLGGSLESGGLACRRGEWVHHPKDSTHAPRVRKEGCWCLVRQEGSIRYLGLRDWFGPGAVVAAG